MNSRHRKTREAIFTEPVNGNLEWSRIEALLVAVGCLVIEGSGSGVTFEKVGRKANFHRPDPRKEALKYRVKQVREYLTQLGMTP
ncbi:MULTISPECIES: type II toxin-antitoxin system HicA family toxin [unclassified Thiocapsa]|uniref:type II toxin-antitoxin system HicA family toxin n=1 Tax=unclassified Thiocapsa TaxID=2641286 RepID=UPI0035AE45EA